MKSSKKVGVLFLVVILFISGCSTVTISSNLGYPVNFTREISDDYNIVARFSVSQKAMFTLGGLITFKEIEFDQLISAEVQRYNGDGAINIKIVDQQNATDILINVGLSLSGSLIGYSLTGSPNSLWGTLLPLVLSTRTVIIEGDIIRKVNI